MFGTMARQTTAPSAFGALHKQYVTSLYRRFLRDSLDWNIRRDLWRADAQHIRAEFEHNRNVRNPRELASILNRAEEKLASRKHPDPYKRTYERKSETDRSADVRGRNQVGAQLACMFCYSLTFQPRMFTDEEKSESLKDQRV